MNWNALAAVGGVVAALAAVVALGPAFFSSCKGSEPSVHVESHASGLGSDAKAAGHDMNVTSPSPSTDLPSAKAKDAGNP